MSGSVLKPASASWRRRGWGAGESVCDTNAAVDKTGRRGEEGRRTRRSMLSSNTSVWWCDRGLLGGRNRTDLLETGIRHDLKQLDDSRRQKGVWDRRQTDWSFLLDNEASSIGSSPADRSPLPFLLRSCLSFTAPRWQLEQTCFGHSNRGDNNPLPPPLPPTHLLPLPCLLSMAPEQEQRGPNEHTFLDKFHWRRMH